VLPIRLGDYAANLLWCVDRNVGESGIGIDEGCKRLFYLVEFMKRIVPLLSLARFEFHRVALLKIKFLYDQTVCVRVFATFREKIVLGLFDLEYEDIEVLRNVENYSPQNTATCPEE